MKHIRKHIHKPTKLHTETLTLCECLRCGHIWSSRQIRPTICSHCRSAYWDRPRINKIRKEA